MSIAHGCSVRHGPRLSHRQGRSDIRSRSCRHVQCCPRAAGRLPTSTVGQPSAIGPPTWGRTLVTIGHTCLSEMRASGRPPPPPSPLPPALPPPMPADAPLADSRSTTAMFDTRLWSRNCLSESTMPAAAASSTSFGTQRPLPVAAFSSL